mmetsp:Transcript_64646/g.189130  ORF Transcript_64646/g.189130 Transcript_64646/m.189130 type:complete len:210 (+) Transcript_64646:607-1236(+)
MAEATVLRPALDKKDKLLSPWIQLPALGHQCSFVEWRHSIHGDVHRDALPFSGWRGGNHGDLGLLPTESGAAELEGIRADEVVRASANSRLLELPGVDLQHPILRLRPTPLETAHQRSGAGADDDVDLRHRHAEGRAAGEAAAGKARNLCLRDDRADGLLHVPRNLCDRHVTLCGGSDTAKELRHLSLPAYGLECWCRHWHGTRPPDLH